MFQRMGPYHTHMGSRFSELSEEKKGMELGEDMLGLF